MKNIDQICPKLDVLRKLRDQDRAELTRLVIHKSYQQREIIAHHGDIWPYFMVVEKGLISITKVSAQGRLLGALRLHVGDAFWSPSFLDEKPLPASLEAKEDSRGWLWHREELLPFIRSNPEAMWDLIQVLARRMRHASGFVEELGFQPVAGRLARLILTMAETSDDPQINRDMTLEEMAAMTGTTSVMVCKLLSRFADKGMINVSRTDFELIDKDQLGTLAKASN
ncbi:MAG TPA: Crp/Fnr family transcriptional regulator [Anaerolineae bacterium]|nr:Crp/Fnr family transcriptional regulator [Anaerolineae bacterium]